MRRLLVFATLIFTLLTRAEMHFVTEDYPPFNMVEKGVVGGISSLIVQAALKRAGLEGRFEVLPWARAQLLARNQPDTCMYSAVRTPEREPHYLWIGPLVDDRIALFARNDNPVKLTAVAEAGHYHVGSYLGDAYGDYIERQGVPLDRSSADANNLPKLMSGHIDLWVAGSISGSYRARMAGYAGKVRQVIAAGDPKDTQMWLACNPATDPQTFKRLSEAVRSVIDDGSAAAFASRYQ